MKAVASRVVAETRLVNRLRDVECGDVDGAVNMKVEGPEANLFEQSIQMKCQRAGQPEGLKYCCITLFWSR